MNNLESITIDFYYYSLRNELDKFDFEEAFEELEPYFHDKLAEHGLLSYEDFIDNLDNLYGLNYLEDIIPEEFTRNNCYVYISKSRVLDTILNLMYDEYKDAFEDMGTFQELNDLYEQLQNPPKSLKEKTILFDLCIHAQHETGDIIEVLDTEWCKEEAQELYKHDLENN